MRCRRRVGATDMMSAPQKNGRTDGRTDGRMEAKDGESNSSASGVKAFPYEPGFKILGCQKNSHT